MQMICPYCEQGVVLAVKIIKNNKKIYICDECDTVWTSAVNLQSGIGFDAFMEGEGYKVGWDELEILDNGEI